MDTLTADILAETLHEPKKSPDSIGLSGKPLALRE